MNYRNKLKSSFKQESLNKIFINKMGAYFAHLFLCRIVGFCCSHFD